MRRWRRPRFARIAVWRLPELDHWLIDTPHVAQNSPVCDYFGVAHYRSSFSFLTNSYSDPEFFVQFSRKARLRRFSLSTLPPRKPWLQGRLSAMGTAFAFGGFRLKCHEIQ